LLHNQATIEDHQGVFLGTTYRMHSAVNEFISQAIYEGKLEADPDNDKQVVTVPDDYQGPLNKSAGIIYIPVEHEGNSQASDEEVDAIRLMAHQLLGRTFHSKEGESRLIGWDDILFVAPYNHQVNKLREALGEEAKIGSVDKFQGQEAPIVFFSMSASRGDDSPRGVDFLFDKNRINVAISRAQSLAIVVGNPALAITNASTVSQQSKINLFSLIQQTGQVNEDTES
jgi:superfamily I DNA and/or RNA helicase